MEKLAEVIKVLAEKHLVPFISSLVLAGIVHLFVPSDWWVIGKMQTLTPNGFFWLVTGVFFLVITLIMCIVARVSAWKKEQEQKRQSMRVIINGTDKAVTIWDMVDELTDEQLSCVKRLVKRKNRPIKVRKNIESDNWWKHNNTDIIRKAGKDWRGPYTLYSLGKSFYNPLSTLYQANGTIMRKDT